MHGKALAKEWRALFLEHAIDDKPHVKARSAHVGGDDFVDAEQAADVAGRNQSADRAGIDDRHRLVRDRVGQHHSAGRFHHLQRVF